MVLRHFGVTSCTMDEKLTISEMVSRISYGSIVHWRMLIIIGQAYNGYQADPSVRWSVGLLWFYSSLE